MSPTPTKRRKLTHDSTPIARPSGHDDQIRERLVSTSAKRSSTRRRIPSAKAAEAVISSPTSDPKCTQKRSAQAPRGLEMGKRAASNLHGSLSTPPDQSKHRASLRQAGSPKSGSTSRKKVVPLSGTAGQSTARDRLSPLRRKRNNIEDQEEDELARAEVDETKDDEQHDKTAKRVSLSTDEASSDPQPDVVRTKPRRRSERRVLDRRKVNYGQVTAEEEEEEEGQVETVGDKAYLKKTNDTAKQLEHDDDHPLTELLVDKAPQNYLNISYQYAQFKHIALSRLMQKRPIPLTNLADERAKVHALLSQTIAAGEGNSMLVIGARGTGKTALVNSILSEVTAKHKDKFHVIRLNGFFQTDDKLALREIWRQLGRELDPEEDLTKPGSRGSNYADTLAKLLALLSHPDEQLPQSFNTSEISGHEQMQPRTLDAAVVAKSVVFVMDEFDLFATHPRQTLLYNLFDIAQSKKAPIAILGLTTRIDVAESLEKRVKSRFSHRYVHLPLPRTLEFLRSICVSALTIHEHDVLDANSDEDVISTWNSSVVNALLDGPVAKVQLGRIFATTRSPPDALTSLILPLSTFDPARKARLRYRQDSLLPPHSSLHVMPSLSILQLALLICAARLEIIHSSSGSLLSLGAAGLSANGSCNFNAAYQEYVDLVARARLSASSGVLASGTASLGGAVVGGRVWGREVARTAWQALRRAGLLVGGSSSSNAHVRPDDLLRCDVALEEVEEAASASMPTGLQRWCREI